MGYSLGQAAKAAGRSKTTIHRAVKSGKLFASRTEDGGWSIDPAELSRAYPGTGNGTVPMERSVTAERPDVERDSPLGRPPHCEPDLLPEGQFERVAVGVGDPRNITDRFAEIGRGTGRPTLSAGFRTQPVDLLATFAGDAEMAEWPKRRVRLARAFNEYDDKGARAVGEPNGAQAVVGASVHDGHARVFFVKRNARIQVAHVQRDMGQSHVRHSSSPHLRRSGPATLKWLARRATATTSQRGKEKKPGSASRALRCGHFTNSPA